MTTKQKIDIAKRTLSISVLGVYALLYALRTRQGGGISDTIISCLILVAVGSGIWWWRLKQSLVERAYEMHVDISMLPLRNPISAGSGAKRAVTMIATLILIDSMVAAAIFLWVPHNLEDMTGLIIAVTVLFGGNAVALMALTNHVDVEGILEQFASKNDIAIDTKSTIVPDWLQWGMYQHYRLKAYWTMSGSYQGIAYDITAFTYEKRFRFIYKINETNGTAVAIYAPGIFLAPTTLAAITELDAHSDDRGIVYIHDSGSNISQGAVSRIFRTVNLMIDNTGP